MRRRLHRVARVEPRRLSAALFGAFYSVFIALRQQGGFKRSKNPSKIASRQVLAVLAERVFAQAMKIPQLIIALFARDLKQRGRKPAR